MPSFTCAVQIFFFLFVTHKVILTHAHLWSVTDLDVNSLFTAPEPSLSSRAPAFKVSTSIPPLCSSMLHFCSRAIAAPSAQNNDYLSLYVSYKHTTNLGKRWTNRGKKKPTIRQLVLEVQKLKGSWGQTRACLEGPSPFESVGNTRKNIYTIGKILEGKIHI